MDLLPCQISSEGEQFLIMRERERERERECKYVRDFLNEMYLRINFVFFRQNVPFQQFLSSKINYVSENDIYLKNINSGEQNIIERRKGE